MTTRTSTLQVELAQFIGTEKWFRHSINRAVSYTEGVKHFADQAGCYWFLDILATQPEVLKQAQTFANIKLSVDEDLTALITVDDGNGSQVYQKKIGFTDCPAGDWKFYFYNGVIMLTSEY